MQELDDARSRLRSGDRQGALDALLLAWRATRAPEVADAIEVASRTLARTMPPITGKTEKAAFEAWVAFAADVRPHTLGLLLPDLFEGQKPRVRARMAAIADIPDDPRLGRAFCDHVVSRWTDLYQNPAGTALFKMLPRHADESIVARLKASRFGDASDDFAYPNWRRQQMEKLEAALKKQASRALTDAEKKVVAEIAGALADAAKGEGEALLANAKGDSAARMVAADQLLEEGNPRGEFVALQTAASLTTEKKRERELLRAHGKAWMGALSRMIELEDVRFEGGVLTRVALGSTPLLHEILDAPEWETVRELEPRWSGERGFLKVLRRWPNVGTVASRALDVLEALARAAPPIESVRAIFFDGSYGEHTRPYVERILEGTAGIPNLDHVGLDVHHEDVLAYAWIFDAPIAARLREITLLQTIDLGGVAAFAERAPRNVTEIRTRTDGWRVTMRRGADRFDEIEATWDQPERLSARDVFELLVVAMERLAERSWKRIALIEKTSAPTKALKARFEAAAKRATA